VEAAFPGLGTVINVVTVVVGAVVGMSVGHRFPARTRAVVTDCLGLVTLLVAALSALEITSSALVQEVGPGVPMLIVLGSLLLGGIAGSVLRIEQRLESLAGTVQAFVARRVPAADVGGTSGGISPRERFVEGWLTTSLLFCVGPLTILGSLSDGLGRGIDQLVLKATLDGFAAMAFASTFGLGVLFSAVSVAVVQGSLTVVGVLLGTLLPEAHIAALTAVGGLLLVGVALRLLRLRDVPVGDLLPALAVAPVLTWAVSSLG
jgi:uncharacterized membrane protein YqgA involved in biofilm formation